MTRASAPPPRGRGATRRIRRLIGAIVLVVAPWAESEAQTIEYLLGAASNVRAICTSCEQGNGPPEELHGKFDLTIMPIPDAHTIEAVTSLLWHSESFRIAGAGFLERIGRNRVSMVIDATVNRQSVLLTSTSHPTETDGSLRFTLASAPDAPLAIAIELVAFPNTTDAPDADADGIPDVMDLCPQQPENTQSDADVDGVGDACDACPDTPLGLAVLDDGCSLEQTCPCAGPIPGTLWPTQRDYLTCVARVVKSLVGTEEITRTQARQIVQAALKSGCGTPLIALLKPPFG